MAARDYPNPARVKANLTLELRRILDAHYALQDEHAKTLETVGKLHERIQQLEQRPTTDMGATTSKVLGLRVQPADFVALANGATLKFDKPSGTLKFS